MPLIGVRHKLIVLRKENPHWSLGDLGRNLGVTRERCRQLLNAEGLPTRRTTPKSIMQSALDRVQKARELAQERDSALHAINTPTPLEGQSNTALPDDEDASNRGETRVAGSTGSTGDVAGDSAVTVDGNNE